MNENKCKYCDEENKIVYSKKYGCYLCGRHKQQLYKYGKILEKTKFTKNDIIIYDEYAEIILVDTNWNEIARTQISLDKVDIIKGHKWRLRNDMYIESRINKKQVLLHRLILNANNINETVDHIDGNKLNNMNDNLRMVTVSQNQMNKALMKSNTSGVTGITWDKSRNKWKATINYDNKCVNLGRYDNFEEAVSIRKQAEIKYHKEYQSTHRYNIKEMQL